jgi:hypothetical protein
VPSVTAYHAGMRRALRRWGWRDWLVLAALASVVAASLLPWFGRAVASGDETMHFDVSAWTGSSQWTIAVLLAVVAGAGWLIARSLGRLETVAGLSGLALVATSMWLTVQRWHSIPGPGTGHYKLVITVAQPSLIPSGRAAYVPPPPPTLLARDPHAAVAIHRDGLRIEHLRGYWSDVRFGLYLGMAAMSLLALMLLAALATHRARADAAGDG